MTKKRSSEIFGVKVEISSGRDVIQKSWSANKFSVPPPKRDARSPPLIFGEDSRLQNIFAVFTSAGYMYIV